MKKILFFVLISSCQVFAQSEEITNQLLGKKCKPIFEPISGEFKANHVEKIKINNQYKNLNYGFKFDNKTIDIQFHYPQNDSDNSCSYFIVFQKRINLIGKFENDFACDLDINSFKLYEGEFKNKKYLLLTCINNGSGGFSTTIIFHLFEVTNKHSILYHPLWSRYGSIACLGDFNKDGILDFLKIRNNERQTGTDTFKASLMSLDSTNIFKDLPKSKEWYFKRDYTKSNKIRIRIIKSSN